MIILPSNLGRKERVTEMSLEDDVQLEVRMDEGHVFEGGWQVSWYLLHVALSHLQVDGFNNSHMFGIVWANLVVSQTLLQMCFSKGKPFKLVQWVIVLHPDFLSWFPHNLRVFLERCLSRGIPRNQAGFMSGCLTGSGCRRVCLGWMELMMMMMMMMMMATIWNTNGYAYGDHHKWWMKSEILRQKILNLNVLYGCGHCQPQHLRLRQLQWHQPCPPNCRWYGCLLRSSWPAFQGHRGRGEGGRGASPDSSPFLVSVIGFVGPQTRLLLLEFVRGKAVNCCTVLYGSSFMISHCFFVIWLILCWYHRLVWMMITWHRIVSMFTVLFCLFRHACLLLYCVLCALLASREKERERETDIFIYIYIIYIFQRGQADRPSQTGIEKSMVASLISTTSLIWFIGRWVKSALSQWLLLKL